MQSFLQRHAPEIIGVLSGWDRLRLRGTLQWLAHPRGLMGFLSYASVLLKDFKEYALSITGEIRDHAEALAKDAGRPVEYLTSGHVDKEALARKIAARDGVTEGLIAVFSCVEGCWSYKVAPNRASKKLELRGGPNKCIHLYFYEFDPLFGFMHTRLQTWFPFTIQTCLNGREWLSRQLDAQRIGYVRKENCFVEVADIAKAQALLQEQLRVNWETKLHALARRLNPAYVRLANDSALQYYWSADESEWATDVLFRSPAKVKALYPSLLHHGLTAVSSADIMRFLGQKVPAHGGVNGRFQGEVVTDLKCRPEGMRIKHRLNRNSIKMYDKQGSVLRVETTINEVRDLKSYRAKRSAPDGPKEWRPLRKGLADMHRRTQISQAANERYLESMASVEETVPLGQLVEKLCQSATWKGSRVRALNPFATEDARWLEAVSRGEFTINGFRNRDLRGLLFTSASSAIEQRRQSGKITRIIRLLRAHGLLTKVPKTHRYIVSPVGRRAITALLTARKADTAKLSQLVA